MGKVIADAQATLVYGGASRGLMGVLADAVMNAGGQVIGVMPQTLVHMEIAHPKVTELKIVPDLHVRKSTMATLADAFIALPGGAGTLEELLEMITWLQLGLHNKPIALLNTEGYYDPLVQLFEASVREQFIPHRSLSAASLWKQT
jgi:uncharacterized protein (TIGR00730 family)